MTHARNGRRQVVFLVAVIVLQAIAAIFFLSDAMADLMFAPTDPHSLFETLVALALLAGVVMGLWQLRRALDQIASQDRALGAARGAIAEVIAAQFELWGLTPAEKDVGLLALKGLDVTEIARLRDVADGTVRAQLTRIYAKAGVSGRAQFAAWFVEDLLDYALIQPNAKAG